MNLCGDNGFILVDKPLSLRNIGISVKRAVAVIAPRREGENGLHQPEQVLRFAGKGNDAVGRIAVVKRANADGVTRSNYAVIVRVNNHTGKFRVKVAKHFKPIFLIQRQKNLTVRAAQKAVAALKKLLFQPPKAVNFAVANCHAAVLHKGLHAAFF